MNEDKKEITEEELKARIKKRKNKDIFIVVLISLGLICAVAGLITAVIIYFNK